MKKLFLVLSITISIVNLKAQAPTIEWSKTFGGSNNEGEYGMWSYSLEQTTDGGYIFAGVSNSNNGDVVGSNGGNDGWVVKLNPLGNIEWSKVMGNSGDQRLYSIQQTTDGGYITVGKSNNLNWMVKLNNSGNISWETSNWGNHINPELYSVEQTPDGGYIVGGIAAYFSNGTPRFSDFWLIKTDNSGNKLWENNYGGFNYDNLYQAKQTTDGGYIMVGTSNSNDGDVSQNYGMTDALIIKTDENGNKLWAKSIGYEKDDLLTSILETEDGYISVGRSKHNANDPNDTSDKVWVVKLNNQGQILWEKFYGGSGNQYGYSINKTNDNGFVISAMSSGSGGDVHGNHQGQEDGWVFKINSSGNLVWSKLFGGSSSDWIRSVVQTSDGGYVTLGWSKSNNGDVPNNLGGYDYWVLKLSPDQMSTNDETLNSISFYPNPSKDQIHFTQILKNLEIYNLEGKMVLKNKNIQSISVKHLQSGNYFIKAIDSQGKIFNSKFIKL